jgi:hypothetical protein
MFQQLCGEGVGLEVGGAAAQEGQSEAAVREGVQCPEGGVELLEVLEVHLQLELEDALFESVDVGGREGGEGEGASAGSGKGLNSKLLGTAVH